MTEEPQSAPRSAAQPGPALSFAEIMGRIFELGFNTGFLATLAQRTDLRWFAQDLFTQDLTPLHLPALVTAAQTLTQVKSTWDRDMVHDWVHSILFEGYLAGENFLAEFLATLRQGQDEHWMGTVYYLQCTFSGKNTLETVPAANPLKAAQRLLEQFARASASPVMLSFEEAETYTETGAFLNADLLMLLRDSHGWRILCVDLSIFGLAALKDTHDLHRVASLRKILRRNLRYLRSRSVFTNLSIDTDDDATTHELLHDQLSRYFTAFAREDKETLKFIQAASYTGSFYDFLVQRQLVPPGEPILFHVVGYTDRAMNAMALKPAQLPLLRTCQTIYRTRHSRTEITQARAEVIGAIQRAADQSFQGTEPFATKLLALAEQGDCLQPLDYEETLTGFLSTLSIPTPEQLPANIADLLPTQAYEGKPLRDIHRALVHRELALPERYLFLTGHPGIGKTSALAAFLSEAAARHEGFVLLYASPRSQVNLDIFKTFQDAGCANLWGLTTSSSIIRRHQGHPTVEYLSSLCEGEFREQGMLFAPLQSEEDAAMHALSKLQELQENILIDRSKPVSGVLKSLCEALGTVLTAQFPAAHDSSSQLRPLSVVATVAIQSLKRTPNGENTLRHLKTILKSVMAQNKLIPLKTQQLAQRFSYFFVMIDEITGDEGGAEFLEGIHRFFQEYQFEQYGIHPKIIVADASIIDTGVIQTHLSTQEFEPQKIYFRCVSPTQARTALLHERLAGGFKRCPAVVINANAYPASALHLTYRLLTNSFQYDEERYQEQSTVMRKRQQDMILQDIVHHMDSDPASQIVVYIQDKKRLNDLIGDIAKNRPFMRGRDYLDIHANLSEKQKKEIRETQDRVQVVFMTASASRGLSFKRAKHILVDIPHFALEQNLMEILQVIYRGRGGALDLTEKHLTFYLADQLLYLDEQDRTLALKEQLSSILNVLLILKTAISTRIFGYGQLGRRHFRMIPIGGKSLSTATDTFSNRLSELLVELNKTTYPTWANKQMVNFIEGSLRALLSQSALHLVRTETPQLPYHQPPRSYLEQMASFAHEFVQAADHGFHQLLTLPVLETAYLTGGLLIVPVSGKSLREQYRTSLLEVLKRPRPGNLPDVLSCMEMISTDPLYPISLRSALGDAVVLLRELKKLDPDKSAYYEQESTQSNSYYAFPLFTFQALDTLQEYFARPGQVEEQEELPFQELLRRLIQSCYPADSFLPMGKNYKTVPFVLFRSFQLGETRQKIFTQKYLFSSQELNILNMLMSSEES